MIKSIHKNILYCAKLLANPYYQCVRLDPKVKHYSQIAARAHRRGFLNKFVLKHTKQIIYGQRRKLQDNIINLKKQKKCAGVIIPHSNNQDQQIDIVLNAPQMHFHTHHPNYGLETVYVRVDGIEKRCILVKVVKHHQGFVQKVYLKQYIVNQPNQLVVPIQLTHYTQNPYIQRGHEIKYQIYQTKVICYNDDYPNKFFVDISFVCPERPYKMNDLANTFPPGLILHPSIDPNRKIVQIILDEISQQSKKQLIKYQKEKGKKEKQKSKQKTAAQTSSQKTQKSGTDKSASSSKAGSSKSASQSKKK